MPQMIPHHKWCPGPSTAIFVAMGGPAKVWQLQMVHFAASSPPVFLVPYGIIKCRTVDLVATSDIY